MWKSNRYATIFTRYSQVFLDIAVKLDTSLLAHLRVAARVTRIIPIHDIIDTVLIGSRVKWDRVCMKLVPLWPNSRDAGYGVDFNLNFDFDVSQGLT